MPDGIVGAAWAFGWGLAAASGALVGAILGLIAYLRHRAIAAFMSFGSGVLLSAASFKVASRLSSRPARLPLRRNRGRRRYVQRRERSSATANDRKRCGECKPQPSEAEAPGSGTSIALGTALDAVPEALVLGVTRGPGDPILHWSSRFRSRTRRRPFPGRPVCVSRPAHLLTC